MSVSCCSACSMCACSMCACSMCACSMCARDCNLTASSRCFPCAGSKQKEEEKEADLGHDDPGRVGHQQVVTDDLGGSGHGLVLGVVLPICSAPSSNPSVTQHSLPTQTTTALFQHQLNRTQLGPNAHSTTIYSSTNITGRTILVERILDGDDGEVGDEALVELDELVTADDHARVGLLVLEVHVVLAVLRAHIPSDTSNETNACAVHAVKESRSNLNERFRSRTDRTRTPNPALKQSHSLSNARWRWRRRGAGDPPCSPVARDKRCPLGSRARPHRKDARSHLDVGGEATLISDVAGIHAVPDRTLRCASALCGDSNTRACAAITRQYDRAKASKDAESMSQNAARETRTKQCSA
eukprot:3883802-Rhodomonas_salina.2